MDATLVLALFIWWTVAVLLSIAFLFWRSDSDVIDDNTFTVVSWAILWPLTAPVCFVIWLSLSPFKTAEKISKRLKDQGLYKEFCAWYDAKTKQENK